MVLITWMENAFAKEICIGAMGVSQNTIVL